jgi:L-fuconolactonase
VCTLAARYPEVVGIVTDFLGGLSEGDREAILGGNAARFYSLGPG